jgi:uncharacterized membrane protein YoaK (UPF0700 family)
MAAAAGAASAGSLDEEAFRRGAASVRHPLTRALVVLTFTTGLVDAVSYLDLGRVFTANMTGNVVLLGFGVAGSGGLPVVAPIVSLASFVVGAGAGGVLVRRMSRRHLTLVAYALALEASLLGLAAIVAGAASVRPGDAAAYLMIVLMAFAMGIRNATVRSIGVPDMTTTVLTMTMTGLAADSLPAGGSGKGSLRRLAAVLAMFVGALAGALLLNAALFAPLVLAGGLALVTWQAYVPAARRARLAR